MAESLEDRTWSSYWAMIGEANVPGWLDKNWLLNSMDQIRQQLLLEC